MRVLVTGATGFIGRNVCRALRAAGHEVRALVRPTSDPLQMDDVETYQGDVTVPEVLPPALEDIDAVIHLAGVKQASRPSMYRRVNTGGTRHLAEACRGRGIKHFIFLSSLSAQGPSPVGRPHREPGGEGPINDYGESKLEAERLLAAMSDLPVTVLRPCVIYGEGDVEMLAWARLIRRRLVPLVPDLNLGFLHVEDLCGLLLKILARDDARFGPYFLSDGQPVDMTELVDLLERLSGGGVVVRLPLSARMLASMIPVIEQLASWTGIGPFTVRRLHQLSATGWTCLPDRAREELGFEPTQTLMGALPAVFDGYRARGWLD